MKKVLYLFTLLFLFAQSNAQEIIGVSPTSINKGTVLNLTITCAGTTFTESDFIDVSMFDGGAGWLSAEEVTTVNNSKIVAKFTIPANATAGVYDVEIYDSKSGSFRAESQFTINYDPSEARIASVTPGNLLKGQRLNVSITGVNTHFTSGSQTVQFAGRWGEEAVVNQVTANSATSITANVTFPNSMFSANMYSVSVYNGTDGYLVKQNAVTVQASESTPEVTSISPAMAPKGSRVYVTIKAKDVTFTLASRFDLAMNGPGPNAYIESDSVRVVNDSTLVARFSIPVNAPAGNYSFYISTNFDGFISSGKMFGVTGANGKIPELVSVTPNTAKRGETLNLQITGANTSFSQATAIQFELYNSATSILPNSVTAINNTTLNVNITIPLNAQLGSYQSVVSSDNDGFLYLNESVTITSKTGGVPKIIGVTPAAGNKGQTLDLTITGQFTSFEQASNLALAFYNQASNITVNNVTALSDTEVKANISVSSAAQAGTYAFVVSSELDGYLYYQHGFKVNPGASDPQLVSISKNQGAPGQTLDITITGLNTHFNQASGVFEVQFFSSGSAVLPGLNAQGLSATQLKITVNIPDDESYKGLYSLGVYDTSTDQYLTLEDVFSVFSVGLNDIKKEDVAVFPVPAHDVLNIKTDGLVDGVQLINSIGQLIPVRQEDIETQGLLTTIRLQEYKLKPGFYYLNFRSGSDQVYRKILIN
ncbi:MAG: T9SS type A sorting domain-containing protein [Bacteroidota bacterium]